jgi:hypothetical protein
VTEVEMGAAMKAKTASVKKPPVKIFPLKLGGVTVEVRLPPAMSAREFETRYRAEVKALRQYYCSLFGFWKFCAHKPCRKARACAGNALTCLKRNGIELSNDEQFLARQKVLEATPRNIGAPERMARQTMPCGLAG